MNKVTFLDVEGVHISSTASLLICDFLSSCDVRNYSNILDTQRVFAFCLSGRLNENYQRIIWPSLTSRALSADGSCVLSRR